MRKFLSIVLVLFSLTAFAQTEADSIGYESKRDVSGYVATGISITNLSNFAESAYPSVEGGVMINNAAVGLVFGRNNFARNAANEKETIGNYWTEVKTAYSVPVRSINFYGLLGIGTYFENGNIFIEYGLGVSKDFEHIGVFSQWSNWDGVNYISNGVSFSF